MNSNLSSNESKELIANIKKVFAKVKYPGDSNLVRGYCWEAMDYKKTFSGKDWRDLDAKLVCANYAAICFFSHEAFRYYLPGNMILCIQDLEGMDQVMPDLVNCLTLPQIEDYDDINIPGNIDLDNIDPDSPDAEFLEFIRDFNERNASFKPSPQELADNIKDFHKRCDPLSLEQKQAVRAFLKWLIKYGEIYFDDEPEPEIAIKRYWGNY